MTNSELIAQIESAANEELMCRAACDTSDQWQDVASPENILQLVAYVRELEASHAKLRGSGDGHADKGRGRPMNNIDKQALKMSMQRVYEISKGSTMIVGEKERLANTALYLSDELNTATAAFQAAGFAQLDAEEKLEAADRRIAELESRTLTIPLPKRKCAEDYVDEFFDNSDAAAIYNACRLECEVKIKNACAAAGMPVKVEGGK
ncbi:hypothetical protein TUM12370_24680 [Salmonella enterica subsp. enterica serovar Choleraesuis]|nr:hypothetical protein TUM12370_24680 [Salmonella enterica subsp. enterica serovar Choleraesuis]